MLFDVDDKPRKKRSPPSFRTELIKPPPGEPPKAKIPPVTYAMLSEDQAYAYDSVMAWLRDPNARQWLTLGGLAGTGKTTLVSALANEMKGRVAVAFGAYTGKASNVLGRKLSMQGLAPHYCGTLHGLLYKPITEEKTGKVIGWTKLEVLPYDLVVVDEASMVGEDIWNDLLCTSVPVLAVGDHGQLPPVGAGAMNLLKEPDLRLEKIHRQAADNPIIKLAHYVRGGGLPRDFRADDDRVQLVRSFPQVVEVIAKGGLDAAAICYFNKTRVMMNAMVRRARGFDGLAPDPEDLVVCLKNAKPLFNGMRGIVRKAGTEPDERERIEATVDFPDDMLRCIGKFNLHQFNREKTFDDLTKVPGHPETWSQAGLLFDYGYAVTCHKFQGSQARDVVVRHEIFWKDDEDTRRRWAYTAFTRASERLYIIP